MKNRIEEPRTIALNRSGNLFFIESQVDGQKGNFVLDTGAEGMVLNETYFRDFSIDQNREVASINGTVEYAKYIRVRDLIVGGLEFSSGTVDVSNLSRIENDRGFKVLGLLGLQFFKDHQLEIDFLNSNMTLFPKDYEIKNRDYEVNLPMRYHNGVPSAEISINTVALRFILDTGAEMNVIHNDLDEAVYEGMEIVRSTTLLGSSGERSLAIVGRLKNVKIARKELDDPLSLILDMRPTQKVVSKDIAGFLGFPFFVQGRVLLDIKKKRLYMSFNEIVE